MAAKTICIDNGSLSLKVGFGAVDLPKILIPSIAAFDRSHGKDAKPVAIADDANERRVDLHVNAAITRGLITDMDSMELLWKHALEKIEADLSDMQVFLTEPLFTPIHVREKVFEIWIEKFQAKAVASCTQPFLSYLSTGSHNGIIVDIGEGITQIAAIAHGTVLPDTCKKIPFAGIDLTENMVRLLGFRGYPFRTSREREIARDLKECAAYVAFDLLAETAVPPAEVRVNYALPDGKIISIEEERYRSVEPLFNPALLGLEAPSLAVALHRVLQASPIHCRRDLAGNILLCGGTSLLPGIADRLQRDLSALVPASMAVKVSHCALPATSTWLGGSLVALLDRSSKLWISSEDYAEVGARKLVARTPANPL